MLSLDIESLFPSIPLEETINYANEVFMKNSGQNLNKIQIAEFFYISILLLNKVLQVF